MSGHKSYANENQQYNPIFQREESVQFLIEAPAATPVGQAAATAAEMHNLVRRIHRCFSFCTFALQSFYVRPRVDFLPECAFCEMPPVAAS